MQQEHVLIIRFSALGDVAMTVPVVYSLAKRYPDVHFTMLSKSFARPLFEGLADNVSFISADLKGEYRGLKGLNALYRKLSAMHFTAVADLHSVLRTHYLRLRFRLAGYPVASIDKHRAGKRRLVSASNKRLTQQPTSFSNYAEVFGRLGYPVTVSFTSIYHSGKAALPPLPETIGQKKRQWIGIAPFAAHAGKIYPLRLMEQVIARLAERHEGCRIFLFGGGPDERDTFAQWCARHPQCVSVPEILSGLGNELALMSHLDVMLSMDSGNMHLASLAGIPVVSVWGATHPFAGFMGWGQSVANAVQLDLPCRPCSIYGNKPCMRGDMPCLKNISPEQITERIEAVLNSI